MSQPTVPPASRAPVPQVPLGPPPAPATASASGLSIVTRADRRRDPEWRQTLVRRVRAEYVQMPGLRLTLNQAQRLFGLRADICLRILRELEQEGFLRCDRNGMFARRLEDL